MRGHLRPSRTVRTSVVRQGAIVGLRVRVVMGGRKEVETAPVLPAVR